VREKYSVEHRVLVCDTFQRFTLNKNVNSRITDIDVRQVAV